MDKRLEKTWTTSAFDRVNNEWTSTENHSYSHEPNPETLLIKQAPERPIQPSRRTRPRTVEKEALIFGDAQIPFQDNRSMALSQLAIRELIPDEIVFVGDMLDLPSLSRFPQRSEWVGSTQGAINTFYDFLAQTRSNAPNAEISLVAGNHEKRLNDYIQRNAAEVMGLHRAKESLAVLSIRNLVRLDDLGINYIDGYPNGTLWLEDNLKAVHGTNVAKGGSNAAKYLKEERETTIYGHTHRLELAQRTFATRGGHLTISAASPGALARIDGTVPGHRYSVTEQGEIVQHAEDWQQGLLRVNHEGLHHDITPVPFTEKGVLLNGKRYQLPDDAE